MARTSVHVLLAVSLVAPGLALAQGVGARPSSELRVGSVQPIEPSLIAGDVRGASATAAPVPATIARDYRISTNDLLDIEVLDAEALKRTVRVNAAGMISLPLVGHIPIAGLTAQEAEERIAAKLSEKYLQSPQVSIFVKEFTTERITIEGAVNRPGIFPLAGQMTLLRALAVAGGFGPIANTGEVMVYRVNDQKVRETFAYDVEQIRAGKAEDPVIRGDDLIVVKRDSMRAALKDSIFRDVMDSINPFSVLVPH